jgi:hypothetical protein
MLKNITKIEFTINEKTYQFLADSDSPLSDCKEAVFQMMTYLGKIEENAKNAQKGEQDIAKEMGVSVKEAPQEIIESQPIEV